MRTQASLVAVVCLATLALGDSSAEAQGLTLIVNPGGDRQLALLDPSSGAFRTLAPPIGGVPISTIGGADTLDRNGNRQLFVGQPSGGATKLYSVSTISGAPIASPDVSNDQNGILMLEYDHGENVLYALASVGPGDRQLGVVNLATGAVTLRGSPLAGEGLSTGGSRALDESGNRFFFVGTPSSGSQQLYVVDTSSGAEIASPNTSGPFVAIRSLAWDADDSTLFGLFTLANGDAQLGAFDTATGVVSLRGNPLAGGSFSSSAAAMDGAADRYYLAGQPAGGDPTIYTLDTVSGLELDSHAYSSGVLDLLAAGFDPGPLFADGFESANFDAWSVHP